MQADCGHDERLCKYIMLHFNTKRYTNWLFDYLFIEFDAHDGMNTIDGIDLLRAIFNACTCNIALTQNYHVWVFPTAEK